MDLEKVGRAFQEIEATKDPKEVVFFNTDGPIGKAALELLGAAIDPEDMTSFVGLSPDGETEGDCLFSTTYAMLALVHSGVSLPFRLCTGYFDIPDSAPERIVHAWLEFKVPAGPPVVINVSNARRRPVYAMDRDDYFATNCMKNRIQSVSATDFIKRLKAYTKKHGDDVEAIAFSKHLLVKTRHALSREMKAAESSRKR